MTFRGSHLNYTMSTSIDRLNVKGEPAPRNSGAVAPLSATAHANQTGSNLIAVDKSYQFILKEGETTHEVTLHGVAAPQSAPVRKMEHLSRIRTANLGISTMDTTFMNHEGPEHLIVEKPHFVLCGLPVGAKAVDPHLYLSETRVGSYKTSAKALYKARRSNVSGKARSEPVPVDPEGSSSCNDFEDQCAQSVPPMPPVTPISHVGSAKTKRSPVPYNSNGLLHLEGHRFPGSDVHKEWEFLNAQELLYKQKHRDQKHDGGKSHRDASALSSTHIPVLAFRAPLLTNAMTISTGPAKRRARIHPFVSKTTKKFDFNNPYKSLHNRPQRTVVSAPQKLEITSLDSNFQQQRTASGKALSVPRAMLRVPNPCTDTFLLQMMHDLNRPKSRKSAVSTVSRQSDLSAQRDFEEYVHTKTTNSLMKAQSNIDRYQSRKGAKSAKSVHTETIEEESLKDKDDFHEDLMKDKPTTDEESEPV